MTENTFGDFLRRKRQQCGLSQYQLGRLLKVSDKAVSKWENGLAKPQSQLLYRLSTILGVSVEELLTGRESPDPKKKMCLMEQQHGNIWDKAYCRLMEQYAGKPPIEMISRFEMEKLALMNTDMVLFFDLIAQITACALEKGSLIQVEGGIGASFVAYILGATDINPLPAHYYCPVCKEVEFAAEVADGWRLDKKYCSKCHSLMVRDGHNIPFEVYRHIIGKNAGFDLVISRGFYEDAEETILQYFSNDSVAILNPPLEIVSARYATKMITYAVLSTHVREENRKDSNINSYREYYEFISDKPYLNLIFSEHYEKCIELEKLVNIPRMEVDFLDERVQRVFFEGGIDGCPDFGLHSLPQLFKRFYVKNFEDALQLYGIAFCASVYPEDQVSAYISRQVNLAETITYRDDVFLHVFSKLIEHGCHEFGLAYKVMDQARKGVYCRVGMDEYIRNLLLEIGVSEGYITRLEETAYLFPKTMGIIYIRRTLILLWYRIYYPKEFQNVFGITINDFDGKEE